MISVSCLLTLLLLHVSWLDLRPDGGGGCARKENGVAVACEGSGGVFRMRVDGEGMTGGKPALVVSRGSEGGRIACCCGFAEPDGRGGERVTCGDSTDIVVPPGGDPGMIVLLAAAERVDCAGRRGGDMWWACTKTAGRGEVRVWGMEIEEPTAWNAGLDGGGGAPGEDGVPVPPPTGWGGLWETAKAWWAWKVW